MKLNIFLVLLAILLFACLGSNVHEGFGVGQDIANLGGDIGRGIGDLGQGAVDVVGGAARGVGAVVGGAARGVGDVVGGVGQGISDAVGGGPYNQGYNQGSGYSVEEIEEPPLPPVDNDKWILKSQIVPPVCPKCPDIRTCRQTPCPACPPCARCPEPAFTCEKVPNYASRNDAYLPRPVLADFSQFGM